MATDSKPKIIVGAVVTAINGKPVEPGTVKIERILFGGDRRGGKQQEALAKMGRDQLEMYASMVGVSRAPDETDDELRSRIMGKMRGGRTIPEPKSMAATYIGKCVGIDEDGKTLIVQTDGRAGGMATIALPPPEAPGESVTCQRLRERIGWLEKELADERKRRLKAEEWVARQRDDQEYKRIVNEMGGAVAIPEREFLPARPSPTQESLLALEAYASKAILESLFGMPVLPKFIPDVDKPAELKPEPKRGRMANLDLDDGGDK